MSTENQQNETKQQNAPQKADQDSIKTGVITLETPILARGKELTELRYDFGKLTGWEYLDAMDSDASNTNMFRISGKQAFLLFAKAAAKANGDVDETDLRQRMGVGDVVNATRLGTAFFISTSRAATRRIKGE